MAQMVIILIYVNIRIYHECEGRIEQYVPRITVWQAEFMLFTAYFEMIHWNILLNLKLPYHKKIELNHLPQ